MPLRVADQAERRPPMTLTEAIESGDVLDMLFAQRRMIAAAMAGAPQNVLPQLSNELNKLHAFIREEQERRAAAQRDQEAAQRALHAAPQPFNPEAV